MAHNKVHETTWNLTQSLSETGQAMTESAVEAQKRNVTFAQNTFENGIELLKSHAESTRQLMSSMNEQSQAQPVDLHAMMNSTIAAQERNVRFAQSVVQNGTEVLKSHVQSTRELMQTLAEKTEKQQEATQALFRESRDTYMDFLFAPFSYYRQAIDTAEAIARQGVETTQNIARQGVEAAQKAARQGQRTAESVTK